MVITLVTSRTFHRKCGDKGSWPEKGDDPWGNEFERRQARPVIASVSSKILIDQEEASLRNKKFQQMLEQIFNILSNAIEGEGEKGKSPDWLQQTNKYYCPFSFRQFGKFRDVRLHLENEYIMCNLICNNICVNEIVNTEKS